MLAKFTLGIGVYEFKITVGSTVETFTWFTINGISRRFGNGLQRVMRRTG